jgi:hypothetical protein
MRQAIYKITSPYKGLDPGDFILLDISSHSRAVKLATPTSKQVFIDYKIMNAWDRIAQSLIDQGIAEPVKLWELKKIFPHLSKRIKALSGYFVYMSFYPEYMCEQCMETNKFTVKKGWEKWHYRKKCDMCNNLTDNDTWARNALKPIGF